MAEDHHVIPQQRIKQRISALAIKERRFEELTAAEKRLLHTPLSQVLNDRRNIVRVQRDRHHRAHQGIERLKPSELPRGIHDFAEHFALEGALEHELRLIEEAA
jgi:hypothetical protein